MGNKWLFSSNFMSIGQIENTVLTILFINIIATEFFPNV